MGNVWIWLDFADFALDLLFSRAELGVFDVLRRRTLVRSIEEKAAHWLLLDGTCLPS